MSPTMSPPRRRGPELALAKVGDRSMREWIPAFAGMTCERFGPLLMLLETLTVRNRSHGKG